LFYCWQIHKKLGIESFVKQYDCDTTAIKAALKSFPRNNLQSKIISTAKRLKQHRQPPANGLLNEIEERLTNAFVLV